MSLSLNSMRNKQHWKVLSLSTTTHVVIIIVSYQIKAIGIGLKPMRQAAIWNLFRILFSSRTTTLSFEIVKLLQQQQRRISVGLLMQVRCNDHAGFAVIKSKRPPPPPISPQCKWIADKLDTYVTHKCLPSLLLLLPSRPYVSFFPMML